jgi:hypothetical protein
VLEGHSPRTPQVVGNRVSTRRETERPGSRNVLGLVWQTGQQSRCQGTK